MSEVQVTDYWCPSEGRWVWCPGPCPDGAEHTPQRKRRVRTQKTGDLAKRLADRATDARRQQGDAGV